MAARSYFYKKKTCILGWNCMQTENLVFNNMRPQSTAGIPFRMTVKT